jgi:hypothetical protein
MPKNESQRFSPIVRQFRMAGFSLDIFRKIGIFRGALGGNRFRANYLLFGLC